MFAPIQMFKYIIAFNFHYTIPYKIRDVSVAGGQADGMGFEV